jgi:heme a synthase
LAGLFALIFAFLSFRFRKQTGVFSFAMLGLIMLILNAWIGSIVVATNLLPGLVSIHFMLSFLCIFFIMLSMHRLDPFAVSIINQDDRKWWQILFVVVIGEVLIGTWARERVELLESTGALKLDNGMLDYIAMGSVFAFHRFLPGAIFLFTGWLYFKKRKDSSANAKSFMMFAAIVLLQICFGAFNIVFALPSWSQIIHIVLGSFMPIYAFYFLLVQNTSGAINSSTT